MAEDSLSQASEGGGGGGDGAANQTSSSLEDGFSATSAHSQQHPVFNVKRIALYDFAAQNEDELTINEGLVGDDYANYVNNLTITLTIF